MSSQVIGVTERPIPQVDLKGHTVEELAAVANVSVEAIKRAIALRQKQLIAEQEQHIRRQNEEESAILRQRQEADIANQLAMYQYQQQQYLATSTLPTTVKTTTTTATTKQTTVRQVTTPRPPLPGSNKVSSSIQIANKS